MTWTPSIATTFDVTVGAGSLATTDIKLASGKTFTVQNGADAIITGAFNNNTASTIAVMGTGSTFSIDSTLSLTGAPRRMSRPAAGS